MYGGNSGIDQTWSLFGDFGEPYLPDSSSVSSRVVTLPVSGISIPHVQNQGHLVHDGFGVAGSPESGYHKDASSDVLAALSFQRFLPSNNEAFDDDGGVVDAYTCDEFRMYDFKVRRCVRGRSHDWTECPYAHPGEKARRRDPRKFLYSGTACPDFRKGSCKRGDACELAHGVFECWLHPARYRTQPCKDGTACRRRVCFFAHTPEQLRLLSPSQAAGQPSPRHLIPGHSLGESYDGSPLRKALAAGLDLDAYLSGKPSLVFSPTSTLTGHGAVSPPAISPPTSPTSDSPPLSPANLSANPNANRYSCAFSPRRTTNAMSDMFASLRNLQIGKAKNSSSPWATASSGLFSQSPRAPSCLRSSFSSLPSTPTGFTPSHDIWGFGSSSGCGTGLVFDTDFPEELPTERVESGRDVRASMFAKLRNQNSLDRPETPEVGWVSELVK